MIVFLLTVLAIAVTGGGFAGATYYSVTIIYLVLGTLFVSYIYYFVKNRESLSLGSTEKCLIVFETWGLFYVLLSIAGVNRIMQADLAYEYSFIPRQAVYFFVLPAAILFRDDTYMKGFEWFLKRYGEILFWVLYAAQMLYFDEVMLTVMTQGLLCWLSLRLETNQRWRRWIRIIALLVTPLYGYGELTILIIRMIFFIICIVPKNWTRIVLCLVAAAVFLVVIGCFVLPQAIDETAISDGSMSWRIQIWREEEKILTNTHYLGGGYGTSYPSKTYAKEAVQRWEGQYIAGDGYTEYERMFVTGPHNSFMSLTMRTGIIGLLLFLLFLGSQFWNIVKYRVPPSKSACFAIFAGIVMILFNVGLESPGYLLTFTFFMGVCIREGKKLKEQSRSLQESNEAIA